MAVTTAHSPTAPSPTARPLAAGPSVAALATSARRGDAAAFGELIGRHERAALAVAHGVCRCPQRAADAVQEACLLAWRKRDSLDDPACFGGWLLNIVRRCAIDQLRRGRPRTPPPTAATAEPADAPADRRETESRVRAAIAGLDEDTRVAVALRYYDAQPSRRIAEVLGCTPAAVDMRLKRARDVLRAKLASLYGND